ncbi:hypothetical protein HJFPF1_13438 [Paramyrothecium foliicola]|nr:hypothetical protein HJFPF1_13438 [Paramyrothecium foliicola]
MAESDLILGLIGVHNNLNDHTPLWNKESTANGLIIGFLVVTWVCVVFRIYTRLRVVYSPGWDDVFVFLLLISGTIGSGCIVALTNHGLGKHLLLTLPGDQIMYLKLFWIANATYCMSTTFIKLSLLFQYIRVFEKGRAERSLCVALIALTATWGMAYSFLAWVPCIPVDSFFHWAQGGTCYGYGSPYASKFYTTHLSMAISNMIFDFIILYLPVVSYVRGNNMNTTKSGFLVIFTLGSLVIAISIWRLASIIEHKAGTYPTFDPTWYGPISIILSSLEVDLASICASIPVFWPVLSNKLEKITITHEVKIERTRRFSIIVENSDQDDVEMTARSRSTSQGSLTNNLSNENTRSSRHYKDDFIMSQVSPLGSDGRVEANVTSERVFRN